MSVSFVSIAFELALTQPEAFQDFGETVGVKGVLVGADLPERDAVDVRVQQFDQLLRRRFRFRHRRS